MPISPLPTPPSRQEPATFADRGDAFLGAFPTFQAQANALEENVNAREESAVSAATTAVSAKDTAVTKASEAGASALSAAQSKQDAETIVESLTEVNALNFVVKPNITSPTTGDIDFTGQIAASAYDTLTTYQGAHNTSQWQAATDVNFSTIVDSYTGSDNLTTWTPSISMALTQVYVRVRYESDGHLSAWSDAISFTTPNIYIETPTLTIDGEPSDVGETPTLTTSAFSVFNGIDIHVSTDWEVRLASDDSLVWSSMADTTNKLSITTGALSTATTYKFRARHNGGTYGSSSWVEVQATTKSAFAPVQGQLGFSVEPTSEPFAVLGLAEMTGTNTVGHDNYGNYIHTDGSIVCWMARKWYRVGHPDSPRFAEYGENAIDMLPMDAYPDEATANADGYVLPRAFIDGGNIKSGFFVAKYKASRSGTAAVSVKNGVPLSLTAQTGYTNTKGMISGCTGILADAVVLSRAKGDGWNATIAFIRGWIALTSIAQAQAATSTADCAWYDDTGATNYPKGCNNGALGDTDDATVSYTTAGDSGNANKPLTGSGTPFAKTTHNGSNNGVADVNGGMFEVDLGVTQAGTSATDTALNTSNNIYVLKEAALLKDLTGGFGGATDAWGTGANLSDRYDLVAAPLNVGSEANAAVYWGNGTNQVISDALSGVGRDLAGFMPKDSLAVGATGTNQFGNDQFYKDNVANMFVLSCGYWSTASGAGVFCRGLGGSRSSGSNGGIGFRFCAYVPS